VKATSVRIACVRFVVLGIILLGRLVAKLTHGPCLDIELRFCNSIGLYIYPKYLTFDFYITILISRFIQNILKLLKNQIYI
jgi:hypothetical protein